MPESKYSPRLIEAKERHIEALELRKTGLSYRQIANHLGYAGPSGAYQAIQAAMEERFEEPVQAVIDLEKSRLDAILASIWKKALDPDNKQQLWAVDRVLLVMERRARLEGLDKPTKSEETVKHEYTVREVHDLDPAERLILKELGDRLAQQQQRRALGPGAAESPRLAAGAGEE